MPKHVYPRGYVVLDGIVRSTDDLYLVPGDTEIMELYNEMQSDPNSLSNWSFCAKVIACANKKFNRFPDWLKEQTKNPYLTGYNLGFVLDTIHFIKCGKRVTSIDNWLPLIVVGDDSLGFYNQFKDRTRTQKKQEAIISELLDLPKNSDYLSNWVSYENGLADLVYTLYILFGTNVPQHENWN